MVRVGVLLLGLVCWGTSAFAAPKKNDGKAEFEKAMRYYQAQEFEAALPWFEKAYELSGRRASTIRALAQCERSLKRYEPAIVHFEEYLATKPRPSDATAVAETVAILKELVADQQTRAIAEAPPPPPPAEVSPPPPPPPPPRAPPPAPANTPAITATSTPPASTSIAPWFLVGGGAALAATGGVLFALGLSAAGTVEGEESHLGGLTQ